MKIFTLLIGLILIIEGLPYAAAPEAMQGWLKKLSDTSPNVLRATGFVAIAIGLMIVYVVQKTSFFQ